MTLRTLKRALKSWYNSTMDRVSGWYKYHTQWWLFWIGLVLAAALNADTVSRAIAASAAATLCQAATQPRHLQPWAAP